MQTLNTTAELVGTILTGFEQKRNGLLQRVKRSADSAAVEEDRLEQKQNSKKKSVQTTEF